MSQHTVRDYDDDNDFDRVANEIADRATALDDPGLVSTIGQWVTKLTANGPGYVELDYLRVLLHMLVHSSVSGHFVKPPPAGPLRPLFPGRPSYALRSGSRDTEHRRDAQPQSLDIDGDDGDDDDEWEDVEEEEDEDSFGGTTGHDLENGEVFIKETDMDNGADERLDGDGGGGGTENDNGDEEDGGGGVSYKNDNDKIGVGGKDDGKGGEGGKDDGKSGREEDGKKTLARIQ